MSAEIMRLCRPKVEPRVRSIGQPGVTFQYLMQKHHHHSMMIGTVTLNLYLSAYVEMLKLYGLRGEK